MTEKDKEINELRRYVARLEAEVDTLEHTIKKLEDSSLADAVHTIYRNCIENEICRNCALNRTDGCIITGSPYEWRFPKP